MPDAPLFVADTRPLAVDVESAKDEPVGRGQDPQATKVPAFSSPKALLHAEAVVAGNVSEAPTRWLSISAKPVQITPEETIVRHPTTYPSPRPDSESLRRFGRLSGLAQIPRSGVHCYA